MAKKAKDAYDRVTAALAASKHARSVRDATSSLVLLLPAGSAESARRALKKKPPQP